MTVPPEIVTAAAAWASGHGCHNIGSCSATPLEAFIAGAAAERDRIRQLAGGRKRTLTRPAIDNGPAEALEVVLWRDLADLLDGVP